MRRGRHARTFMHGRVGRNQLKMTSMMDILVTLLFFVLKSFVAEGEAVTPAPGLELPRSSSEALPAESIPVAILPNGILVGEEVVASTTAVRAQKDLWVEALGAKLQAAREQTESIAALSGREAPRRTVTIQGDRDLDFQVLEKVMYTVDRAGYHDVALAVIRIPKAAA